MVDDAMSDELLATYPRLQEIVAEFQESDGSEKIELLLDYANRLPEPPVDAADFEEVAECMTPVSVGAVMKDGRLKFRFIAPKESPTVRGFAAILAEGLDGSTPTQVLALPDDFFITMGLDQVLSGMRMNGLRAILAHMKRIALEYLA